VTRAEQADRARFEALYRETRVAILAYLVRRTASPEDAADLLSEVYVIAWRRIRDVPRGDEARLWLFGVARRVVASHRRHARKATQLAAALEQTLAVLPDVLSSTNAPDPRVEAVAAALASLEHGDRELLMLSAWEDLSPTEIAVVVGRPAGVVRVRLHRARRRLLRKLVELTGQQAERSHLHELGVAPD
jgi:RNA polymerase sigma-70 factor (ECF subfamily)